MTRLSVVMPVYNALPYLRAACESVLKQTFRDFEFLILDDASTDGSGDYLDSLRDERVRVIHGPKCGYAALLNQGLEAASGELIARMDADDVCLPDRFEKQLQVFDNDSRVVVCGCQAKLIDTEGKETGEYRYPTSDAGIRFELLTRCAFSHPGAMYRREAATRVGGYRPDRVPCEDFDLWNRMKEEGRLANCPETLVHYRIHGSNVSFVQQEARHRVSFEVAVNSVIDAGLVANTDEAVEFICLKRKVHSDALPKITLDQGQTYCHYAERFIQDYLQMHTFGTDVAELRRTIRWQFLHRAEHCRMLSRDFRQWIALAIRIDPVEMRMDKVFKRVFGKAVNRLTAVTS